MTISSALQLASSKLAVASDAPRLDAERLLLHVIGQTETSWLYAHAQDTWSEAEAAAYHALIERRTQGEPLGYILGEWEFYGRPFWVTPDVLLPRPATEALVDKALGYIADCQRPLTIADIGTGSGCIAITLALELQSKNAEVSIIATDISPAALAVARRNAERHRVADQIEFVEGDMMAPLAGRQVDFIVSNPPYVPSQEVAEAGTQRDTKGLIHEPQIALDGGPDGQKYVEQIKNAGIPALVETTNGHIIEFP